MLIIDCRACPAPHLGLGTRIESIDRTAEGATGYVRCPAGHLVRHQFADAAPKLDPPAWVTAVRARREATRQTLFARPAGD